MKKVEIGSEILVKLEDEEEWYKIIHSFEADFLKNKISIDSPLAKAVLNHKEGEEISFRNPLGQKMLCKIIKIK